MSKLTEAQRQAMLAQYIDPAGSPSAIARAFGVHHRYPGTLAQRRGLKSPRPQYGTGTRRAAKQQSRAPNTREARLWARAIANGPVMT